MCLYEQQDLLQEHRAVASQQQNNNLTLLTSSDTSLPPSGSRGFRGLRVDESRLSRLALLLRGQSNERRLQGAAREARDRLDERLRSTTLAAPRLVFLLSRQVFWLLVGPIQTTEESSH